MGPTLLQNSMKVLRSLEVFSKYLSKGGRANFMKSSRSNTPTNVITVSLPIGIANCIEKIQSDFLWSGKERKFHLMKWPKVCSLIFEGSLGIEDWLHLIHLCWGSGSSNLQMIVVAFGGGCWRSNMTKMWWLEHR